MASGRSCSKRFLGSLYTWPGPVYKNKTSSTGTDGSDRFRLSVNCQTIVIVYQTYKRVQCKLSIITSCIHLLNDVLVYRLEIRSYSWSLFVCQKRGSCYLKNVQSVSASYLTVKPIAINALLSWRPQELRGRPRPAKRVTSAITLSEILKRGRSIGVRHGVSYRRPVSRQTVINAFNVESLRQKSTISYRYKCLTVGIVDMIGITYRAYVRPVITKNIIGFIKVGRGEAPDRLSPQNKQIYIPLSGVLGFGRVFVHTGIKKA